MTRSSVSGNARPRAAFLRYAALGAVSFALNLGLAALFHEWAGFDEVYAAAFSLILVLIFNFIVARRAVFGAGGHWLRELAGFLAVSGAMRAGEYGLFLALYLLAGAHYLLALGLAQAASFTAKFFLYRDLVFSGAKPTRPSADNPAEGGDLSGRERRDRALFDRIAERYHRKDLLPAHRLARKLRLEQTLGVIDLPENPSLLDAGCGAGFAASYLRGRYGAYCGVDYSKELIASAQALNGAENVRFEAANLYDFTPDAPFDAVFMIGFLHHLDDPAAALSRLTELVKPGGWVVANEPQSGNPMVSLLRKMRKNLDTAYSDEQAEFSRREVETLFNGAGFCEVRIKPQGVLTTPLAEVVFPFQPLMTPISRACCAIDRAVEARAGDSLNVVAWNLIAAGRKPLA